LEFVEDSENVSSDLFFGQPGMANLKAQKKSTACTTNPYAIAFIKAREAAGTVEIGTCVPIW